MQLTIEIDDETYASIEAVAQREHSSIGSVVTRALSRLRKPVEPVKQSHGYKLSVSEGARPFTTEDVLRIEEELYLDGKA